MLTKLRVSHSEKTYEWLEIVLSCSNFILQQ